MNKWCGTKNCRKKFFQLLSWRKKKNGRKEYKKRIIYEPTTHKNTHSMMRETTLVNNCVNCIIKLKNDLKNKTFHSISISRDCCERIERVTNIKSWLVDAHSVILDGRGAKFSHFDRNGNKMPWKSTFSFYSLIPSRSYHNGKCTQKKIILNNFL